jgi:hypothetical protein
MSQDRDVTSPRPNPLQPFQCGFSQVGRACINGPTANGQCCQVLTGGCDQQDCGSNCAMREKCQVADQKKASSKDRENFQKCIPVRSHWNWRNVVALNLSILAAGILLICMSLPNYERLFVPGELSPSHSQILENTLVSDRCSLCHATAHGNVVGKTQEQLCMNCHNTHMPDALAGNPHDLTQQQFRSLVSFHNETSSSQASLPKDHAGTKCAQCHIEHHGGDKDLKAITDARCQACHQQQFSSFSTNHPEFRSFPYDNTRRIAFDHVTHLEKYYTQKNTTFDCKQCHEIDSESPSHIGRTASFEVACASCHQQPLQASAADGWAMMQLPSLNSADLPAGAELLANWPAAALYGYDGKVTLPMRLLLSSDDTVAEALRQFAQGDLSLVRPGNIRQQVAAQTIAAAVRQLLRETAAQGQEAWKQRLTGVASKALKRQPTESERLLIRSMVSGLPPDLFRQMENGWFGKSSGIADSHSGRISATLVTTQELLDGDDPTLGSESADDLLRGSSTQGLNYQTQPAKAKPASQSDLLGENDVDLSADELLKKLPEANPDSTEKGIVSNSTKSAKGTGKLTASRLVGEGGWYLDSKLLTLKYMPSGHADPLVAAWVQFAALIDSTRQPTAAGVDDDDDTGQPWHSPNWKPGSEAVGGCTECHLLPNYSTSALTAIDWRADTGSTAKPFTKFNHQPHMTLAVTADCKHCHQFDNAALKRHADLTKSLGDQSTRLVHYQASQQHFRGEFKAMEKSQCNACHRAGGASEGCTQCHNYHIGTRGLEAMQRTP